MSDNNEVNQETKKFRTRTLNDPDRVFEHNAWDDVELDEEDITRAKEIIKTQSENKVEEGLKEKYDEEAVNYWDQFYSMNENKFFKNRNWLQMEFPELFPKAEDTVSTHPILELKNVFTVMEIGCGTGATAYPLLESNPSSNLRVLACDFSKVAVDLVKSNKKFDENRQKAFVWDMTSLELPSEVTPGSVDIITLIFSFSAIKPAKWDQVIKNLYELLKPGGIVLFRDYGQYDMAQLRFKKRRYLEENFYVRGDGTQVYFFTQEQLADIFGKKFNVLKNEVDRRLIVNRHRQLKMYRVWLQAKFQKPIEE
ncbi:methyltransferase [Neoconidiobolus thromboides FSU 785]|nr:methyltransferase [Neoconidiobolus thromboides FSU 785]